MLRPKAGFAIVGVRQPHLGPPDPSVGAPAVRDGRLAHHSDCGSQASPHARSPRSPAGRPLAVSQASSGVDAV